MYEWIDPFEEIERLRAGWAAYVESAETYQKHLRDRLEVMSHAAMSPRVRAAMAAARREFP